jgi:multiple sugar transport system substrate-binding protein
VGHSGLLWKSDIDDVERRLMMRDKRLYFGTFFMAILLFVAFAGAKDVFPETKKVTVTFWKHSHGPADVLTKELIADFEKEHPNVKIELLVTPWDQHLSKLLVSMAGGIGPDLFDLKDPMVPFYISKGFLDPIDPEAFGFKSQADLEKDWLPASFSTVMQGGKIYGVPFEANSWSLYINASHFKEIGLDVAKDYPKTWEELGEIGAKLTKYDKNGRMTRAGFEWPLKLESGWYLLTWYPIFCQLGGQVVNDAGNKCLINSPAGVRALEIWKDMYYKFKTATTEFGVSTSMNPNVDFANGTLSMWLTGAWARPTLKGDPAVYNNYVVVPIPHVKGGKRVACVNAISWHVNSKSEVKKEAWQFVDFASKHQEQWLDRAGYIITRKGWFDTPTAKKFPYLDVFLDDMSHGEARPRSVHYNEIEDSIKRALQRTMFNKMDPKESMDIAAKEIDKVIKE